VKRTLFTERSYLISCIVLGAAQAWICRYSRIPDGVSYLDIGDAYLRGDWAAAVNAYWSPMYSWCLGLALYLLKPSIWWEFITIHLVNLIIYLLTLFCFRFFLHSVLRALRQTTTESDDSVPLSEGALIALAYCLFLWCSLVLIEVGSVTPDLLLAAIVFLIAGYLVELRVHHSYRKFASFGALSGAAYLGKGIMFPLGFGFLAILLFSGKRSRARICGVLLSGVVFLMVCSPFIFALSKAKGRLTFGDTGKVAYAAMVSPGAPLMHWQGEPAGSGVPRHPTRKLMDDPPVFEFGEPVRESYPPWDDPSYWNEGLQARFRLRSQLRTLAFGALAYERFLLAEPGLLAGVLIFLFIGGKPTRRAIASNWPLLAAAGLSIGTYSLVLVENRYIAASFCLLFVAIFGGIRLPRDSGFESVSKYVVAAIAIAILLTVAGHIVDNAYENLTVGPEPSGRDEVKAAVGLREMGLGAGDKAAVVGRGITNHWARMGRFKIVAEATSPGSSRDFWASSPERRNSAYECLSRTGARAVVAWDPPASALDPRWKRISDTDYYAYFFHK
jgi:Dolichyl-phosphate-mannose-protein mannosyltransferase